MEEQEAKAALLKFTEALSNAGITAVSVSYSGCSDEGRTEDPQLQDAAENPVTMPSDGLDLDALGGLLEHFVPEGYQDGEGGWGTITFDVKRGKIRVEHNWYEIVSHAYEPREV